MQKILQILHWENKGEYAKVYVLLDDGTEAEIYVGGDVEVYYYKGRIRAYVKRNKRFTKEDRKTL